MTTLLLEEHPKNDGGMPLPRVLPPMSDGVAAIVGQILVCWGQMTEALTRYTKCLIEHNGSDPIASKWLEYPKLAARFAEEAEKAFSLAPTALTIARDLSQRADRAKSVRKHLAHDALTWAGEVGLPVVLVSFKTKGGGWRYIKIRLNRLESARLDIEIAHGRILQLGLSTPVPPPYSSLEISILQAIQAKGWTPHPSINRR